VDGHVCISKVDGRVYIKGGRMCIYRRWWTDVYISKVDGRVYRWGRNIIFCHEVVIGAASPHKNDPRSPPQDMLETT
jgi:hypothetical protein